MYVYATPESLHPKPDLGWKIQDLDMHVEYDMGGLNPFLNMMFEMLARAPWLGFFEVWWMKEVLRHEVSSGAGFPSSTLNPRY